MPDAAGRGCRAAVRARPARAVAVCFCNACSARPAGDRCSTVSRLSYTGRSAEPIAATLRPRHATGPQCKHSRTSRPVSYVRNVGWYGGNILINGPFWTDTQDTNTLTLPFGINFAHIVSYRYLEIHCCDFSFPNSPLSLYRSLANSMHFPKHHMHIFCSMIPVWKKYNQNYSYKIYKTYSIQSVPIGRTKQAAICV